MALSVADFQARYKQFAATDPDLLTLVLAEALSLINASLWGTAADIGQGLLAAHKLAMDPVGESARLDVSEGSLATSTYGVDYMRMRAQVTTCLRVL